MRKSADRPSPQWSRGREALRWFRLAAPQGAAGALAMLGVMYAIGKGVPQDFVRAHAVYSLAAANGHVTSNAALDSIARRLSPDALARAQELAREWLNDPSLIE